MGHAECGAIKGACDGAQLRALTATLVKLDKPHQVQGGVSNVNPAAAFADRMYTPFGCGRERLGPLVSCVRCKRKGAAGVACSGHYRRA